MRYGNHYCILDISSGRELYCGQSEMTAAMNLRPGACWGKGESKFAAIDMAQRWARWFRERAAA